MRIDFSTKIQKIKLKIGTMVEKSRLLDMIDNCDVITASSGRAHEYLASSGRKDKHIRVIPSDTDISSFNYQNITPESIQKLRKNIISRLILHLQCLLEDLILIRALNISCKNGLSS